MADEATKNKPADGKTDTSSVAQGRFTVSINADLADGIDAVGKRISDAVQAQTGVAVELTRAQVVQSLVRTALQPAGDNESPAAA